MTSERMTKLRDFATRYTAAGAVKTRPASRYSFRRADLSRSTGVHLQSVEAQPQKRLGAS